MTRFELRAALALAAVFAMRLLGLFMIYPAFASYASQLRGSTPAAIGFALGAYGLTQGLLQIPFGLLSDRLGRKRLIAIGLLLFAAGSIVAARATSIQGVIIGRTLQGTGAVGSVILALVADLTREEVRTRAMALVGMTIGLSFAIALVLGPVLAKAISVSGIFWTTAVLAVVAIGVTYFVVPTPARAAHHRDTQATPQLFRKVIADKELLRLDFAIFALHVTLTASFLAVPLLLSGTLHLNPGDDWFAYLPVLAISVLLMILAVIVAEKNGYMKEVLLSAIVVIGASQFALALWQRDQVVLVCALIGYFTAFNIMEALLPSLVTKFAPAGAKGTATGVFSSAQFLGIFVGGVAGGLTSSFGGTPAVFTFTLVVSLLWLAMAAKMARPGLYSSYMARVGAIEPGVLDVLEKQLRKAPGVIEADIAPDEGVAYLKIDRRRFKPDVVGRILAHSSRGTIA